MKKPKVVEFKGLPNAGKTKHLEQVERELKRLGYSIRFIQDQIRDAPIKGDEVEKNRWAARQLGNLIAVAKEQDWDLILIERGGWALYASLKALEEQSKRKNQIKRARQGLDLALDVVRYEDFFILIEISPKVALERDQESGATQAGTIINLSFLTALEKAYCFIKERLPKGRTKIIDGEEDFQVNQERILKSLIKLIEEKGNSNSSITFNSSKRRKAVHYA